MNRLLTSTIIIITTLYLIQPCSAEETLSSEHDSVKNSEVLQTEDSEVTAKAKPIDFEEDYQSKKAIASDTTVETSKKENLDSFWIEKISGKKLNALKNSLEELQNIYNNNYRTFCTGEAINSTEKAENQKKRNTSLLLNINRESPFSIYATSYIFHELIKLNIQSFNKNLLEIEKNLTDEVSETPEEINKIINKLSDEIQSYKNITEIFQKLVLKTNRNINSLKKANFKHYNLTNLGFYVKKINIEIFDIISKQTDFICDITNQLDYAIDYSEKQIKFINQHKQGIAEKVKYITEIRSCFKDLELFIERLETKEKYNFYLMNKIYSEYAQSIKQLIGNEEIKSGRISTLIKRSRFTQIPNSIVSFSAKDDLNKTFIQLGLAKRNEKLFSVLLNYICDENWHSQYKEENETNTNKTEEKTKPKLIDFEEE